MKGLTSNEIALLLIVAVIAVVIVAFAFYYIFTQSSVSANAGKQCVTTNGELGIYASDGVTCIAGTQSGEDKYYTCPDKTQVLWCSVGS